ncbi:Protein of unknown function [Actinopolyspora xinjiangensis]|uniref:DUF3631 domain-containing protein n=1 Tax=Actinopolyspora xinjiangensis TaxID=405564 RepID=A0A1H0WC17_9ACTN|nr:DUF3631 domain-containing protein [Actinopolyspora xinjiangensis]SDP87866.1 Protein of unknown function [Actinopolyspora xinjiangensis]
MTDSEPAATTHGEALLDELHAALTRYVVLPSPEATDAVVLWIAASHAQPAWAHAPRLVIRGPAKRCGKSRLVDIIEATCHDPFLTVNSSPSAVYRSITDDPPTMLVDEADTIFGAKADGNEDLRGLLNAGHQRNRPAKRYDAASNQVESIPTFAMAALAGIGAMPDTIEDRAVVLHMRRRAPGETVSPYRHRRDRPHLSQLADQLTQWLRGDMRHLEHAEPTLPVEDRAADTWEPLIIVADHAGGSWPDRAREAARVLLAEADQQDQESLTVRLLTDCRTAIGDHAAVTTRYLLDQLNNDAEAPWHEQGQHGLTASRLARLLGEFGIKSANTRFPDGSQAKGYRRADFLDAWNRYCPPPATEPSQPSQASHPSAQRDSTTHWDDPSRPSDTEPSPGQPTEWDGTTRPNPPSRPSLTSIGTPGTTGTTHRHDQGAA